MLSTHSSLKHFACDDVVEVRSSEKQNKVRHRRVAGFAGSRGSVGGASWLHVEMDGMCLCTRGPALLGRPVGGGRALSARHKTNTAVLKLSRRWRSSFPRRPSLFACLHLQAASAREGSCRNSTQEKVEFLGQAWAN